MSSQFGWMDHDDRQRRRVLAAIELFKDDATIDELGVGAVRDTISRVLFPGVSVLHTRARYLLFVPWCVNQATARNVGTTASTAELRRLEVKLIHALIDGDSTGIGIIGRVAKDKIKRPPSAAYWAVLQRWQIRRVDTSVDGLLRDARTMQRFADKAPRSEDAGLVDSTAAAHGFDPDLPAPPAGFLTSASFDLSAHEATYLSERLSMTTQESLIPWLLDQGSSTEVANIWNHPAIDSAPERLREIVELGKQFSILMHGAALLYNVQLAEAAAVPEREAEYRDRLATWRQELEAAHVTHLWNRDAFWPTLRRHNPGLRRPTERFVEAWVDRLRTTSEITDDRDARELIRRRELELKSGRARLANKVALAQWKGASGLVRIDYNWGVTDRILDDVFSGLAA